MKVHDIPSSGKRGKIVAFKSRFGQVQRAHTRPTKPPTASQRRVRAEFGNASLGWNTLTDEQLDAWCAAGKKVRSHPRGGQSGPLTGQNFFTAINRNQALLGLPPILFPPERPVFGANPVAGFSITANSGRLALKLKVARVPAGQLLVFASRPYNAGRRYCDKFVYLGPLPLPARGESNITALYAAKHGAPWPGSRVILQLVHHLNGWHDSPQRIEAVFRPTAATASPPTRRPRPRSAP